MTLVDRVAVIIKYERLVYLVHGQDQLHRYGVLEIAIIEIPTHD